MILFNLKFNWLPDPHSHVNKLNRRRRNIWSKHTAQIIWSNTCCKSFDKTRQKCFDQTHVTNALIKHMS